MWVGRRRSERVDLSEESGFFLQLLDDTLAWRERLVEELKFGSRNHVRSICSYQVDFLPAMLESQVDLKYARKANVLLPLTTRPKRPLLNFALSGPEGAATLTSRASIAGLQAQYLALLAETSSASNALIPAVELQLFEAICGFSPGFFNDTFLKDGTGDRASALAAYLSSGLGFAVPVSSILHWQTKTAQVGEILAQNLNEPPDLLSSSEEVLLSLPRMARPPQAVSEIQTLVDNFHQGIVAAHAALDRSFLAVLAEYGRRYEVVVEVEVPLLEPSRIKIEEDLPLKLKRRRFRSWVSQDFALGDARSAHLEVRVDDPNVELAKYKVLDVWGGDATGWLETVRHTREALAIYSSESQRPYYVALEACLSVARPLALGTALLCVASLLAIAAVSAIGFAGSVGDKLAVLAIPTTIAATFVLAREQTALATRLQWIPRAVLAAITFALWAEIAIGLAVTDDAGQRASVERPVAPPSWRKVSPAVSRMNQDKGAIKWLRTGHEAAVE